MTMKLCKMCSQSTEITRYKKEILCTAQQASPMLLTREDTTLILCERQFVHRTAMALVWQVVCVVKAMIVFNSTLTKNE